MSKEQVEKKLRPYHETVKDAIRRSTNEGLSDLATLIKETKIPDDQVDQIDGIILAWREKLHAMCWGDIDLGVPAALLKQKEAALAKREVAGSGGIVKLEELAVEAEGLHFLLSDRNLGDSAWLQRFREQVYRLHKLLSRLV